VAKILKQFKTVLEHIVKGLCKVVVTSSYYCAYIFFVNSFFFFLFPFKKRKLPLEDFLPKIGKIGNQHNRQSKFLNF